ncbi:MAG: beta-ketoacyl-ACP synthase III [candidate division Zixibacteria bacterium]|nr:beta-ketoacyl-ACP synthase III [candidate division Zixibacteria bacterium]
MTNADFEAIVDTSDDWIVSRTGIRERRITDDDTLSSDMAAAAIGNALEMARCSREEVDALIIGTVTPDYRLPSTACVVQEKMGLPNAVAYDIVAACAAFLNGLTIARGYIESGIYKKIVVVGVEKLTSITNYKDRNTCVLFGDAAGAAVVAPDTNGNGILSTFMKSNGSMRELLWMRTGGTKNPYTSDFTYDGSDKIAMAGSEVFKVAVREMSAAALKVIDDAGLDSSDISLIIPHQANIRIVEALAKRLKVGMDRVYLNIEKYGNTSSASVPLALDEAHRAGRLKPGDHVLMVAFGGGLIWGSALMKW